MRPPTTNSSTQTFDVYCFSFESAGALAFVNEYSGFAVQPARYIAFAKRKLARPGNGGHVSRPPDEAVRDKAILKILDAYDEGAILKRDVLAHTKMRARTYHNAYNRLKRILGRLTDDALTSKETL